MPGSDRLVLVPDEHRRVRGLAERDKRRVQHAVPDEELPGHRLDRIAADNVGLARPWSRTRSSRTGRSDLATSGVDESAQPQRGFDPCSGTRAPGESATVFPTWRSCRRQSWFSVSWSSRSVDTIWHSFTNWDGVTSKCIGLRKLPADLLTTRSSRQVCVNSLIFLISVPLILIASLWSAVLVYEQVLGWKVFRFLFFIPDGAVAGHRRRAVQHLLPARRRGGQGAAARSG